MVLLSERSESKNLRFLLLSRQKQVLRYAQDDIKLCFEFQNQDTSRKNKDAARAGRPFSSIEAGITGRGLLQNLTLSSYSTVS